MEPKINKLKEIIKNYKRVIVAYSGGIDSTLLCYLAYEALKEDFLAITCHSEIYPDDELQEAINITKKYNWPHLVITTQELENEDFITNNKDRCGYCKASRSEIITSIAKEKGYNYILSGENIDDLNDYRPGIKKAIEAGVKMPFIEAEIGKNEIRSIAKGLNIPNYNKAANPCLATRIPYDIKITTKALKTVNEAEKLIRDLGYQQVRVRHYNDLARIEIEKSKIINFMSFHSDLVNQKLKELGYNYVTIDLQGYRTGSLNEAINKING